VSPTSPQRPSAIPDGGLCAICAHQVEVRNTRGSVFSLCARSRTDPAYPRYPRLPVLECRGFEQRSPVEDGGGVVRRPQDGAG
jgi:hypothetical protein